MKKLTNLMRVLALLFMLLGVSGSVFGAYWMKHPWGGGTWEWKQLDGNNQVTAAYGGNGVNIGESNNDSDPTWIGDPIVKGNPSVGTQCIFKYDHSNGTVTITPTSGGTTTTSSDIYIPGDFNSWNQTGNPVLSNGTSTISLTKGTHKFKIIIGTQWYGNGGTMTRTNCTDWNFDANSGDAQINADVAGNYVFTVVKNSDGTPKVSVKYPSNAELSIKSSIYTRNDSDTQSITLTTTTKEFTPANYKWQVSLDKKVWTDLATTTSKTYTLSGAQLPAKTSFYRVTALNGSENVESYTIAINVIQSCGKGTDPVPIFEMKFDTLTSEQARLDVEKAKMANIYDFIDSPYKINDSNYAIVATPYYAGCGNTADSYDSKVTTDCLNERAWYRQYLSNGTTKMRDRDYINNPTSPYIGGMLMINFANDNNEPVFVRELTESDTQKFSTGAHLRFSAWFASAAQPYDDVSSDQTTDINMVLKIQYSTDNGVTWKDGADEAGNPSTLESTVTFKEDWVLLSTELYIVDKTYKYRIVITNGSKSGVGNDVLIDDVKLTVCRPQLGLQFEHPTDKENHVLASTEEEVYALVPVANFGSIVDPCIMLFEESKDASGNVTYSFIDNMVLNAEGTYYRTENPIPADRLFALNASGNYESKPLVMRAVISDKVSGTVTTAICNNSVKEDVEAGRVKPEDDNPFVVFSDNTIEANIVCGSAVISDIDGDAKIKECIVSEGVQLPEITFTLNNPITSDIRYTVLLENESGAEVYKEQFNWDGSSNINISNLYAWEVGKYVVQISVEEYNTAIDRSKPLCVYQAEGQVSIELMGNSDAPVLNRDGEIYAYNMCKTEVSQDKFFFNDLVVQPTDKSGLVWLTMDDKIIPAEDAFFYADVVQEDSVKLYSNPAGSCPSDTIVVRYRVKAITAAPVVNNYKECAKEGEVIALSSLVGNADVYKYLIFKDKTGAEVTEFDPSEVGKTKYYITASQDEIQSASNNYCEAQDSVYVTIKGNATAANIIANDTLVCPNAELVLLAKADFAKEQTNVKLTWYADESLSRIYAYGETFKYYALDEAYKQSPDTVYVTVQSDDYCENVPSEAKSVVISQKEAVPSLAISPASAEVVIGAMPRFTVTPDDAKYVLYVNDVKVSSDATTYKPYLDSEYKLVYQGDCGTSSATANVEVKWPTVFTPYVRDGRNDTFVQDMDPNFYTQIFTRFGTKIYEGPNGWNGSINGSMNGNAELAAPGVYYYVVQLPDGNVKKGTIEVFKY